MAVRPDPKAERIIRYDKDVGTRIATITFDRPECLNAPTIAARHRYADLLHRAAIDDDVKVVVLRGAACDRNRPTDTVFLQKTFFEVIKQFQGEYMGSLLSDFFESTGGMVRADGDDFLLDDAIDRGLGAAVKANDDKHPPEWRLAKKARRKARKARG